MRYFLFLLVNFTIVQAFAELKCSNLEQHRKYLGEMRKVFKNLSKKEVKLRLDEVAGRYYREPLDYNDRSFDYPTFVIDPAKDKILILPGMILRAYRQDELGFSGSEVPADSCAAIFNSGEKFYIFSYENGLAELYRGPLDRSKDSMKFYRQAERGTEIARLGEETVVVKNQPVGVRIKVKMRLGKTKLPYVAGVFPWRMDMVQETENRDYNHSGFTQKDLSLSKISEIPARKDPIPSYKTNTWYTFDLIFLPFFLHEKNYSGRHEALNFENVCYDDQSLEDEIPRKYRLVFDRSRGAVDLKSLDFSTTGKYSTKTFLESYKKLGIKVCNPSQPKPTPQPTQAPEKYMTGSCYYYYDNAVSRCEESNQQPEIFGKQFKETCEFWSKKVINKTVTLYRAGTLCSRQGAKHECMPLDPSQIFNGKVIYSSKDPKEVTFQKQSCNPQIYKWRDL